MKLLIVEDDPKTSKALQKGLVAEGFVADVCGNGEDALELSDAGGYDLIVLDAMMPLMDGWTALSVMRERKLETPVLMLTARDAVEDRVRGLTLGADDYLVKPFAFSELVARIKTILRRNSRISSDSLQIADLIVDVRRHRVTRGSIRIQLSAKELQLLELLMINRGQVLTRTFISERVWDMAFDCDSNVVDVNIRRLRAKIDDPFPAKLIETIRGRGYVIGAEERQSA
jgi:two-component system, OmpR family, copper resistance phosphate regulon response regulator CusR